MGYRTNDFNERTQRQIRDQLLPKPIPTPSSATVKPPTRIRQSSKPRLNKLESEWLSKIGNLYPNHPPVRSQAKRYEVSNGGWYKPDFTCSSWPSPDGPSKETAWEVKGPHAFRGGFEALKTAAHQWPEVRFILVWKDASTGQWIEQEVLP